MKQLHITLEPETFNDGLDQIVEVTIHPKFSGHGEDYRKHDSYFRVLRTSPHDPEDSDLVSFTDSSTAFTKSKRLKKHIKHRILEVVLCDEQAANTIISIIETNV